MASEEIFVTDFTGVDTKLRIAGPGTRSFAFVVDWHIRVLLALSWLLAGVVLRIGVWHESQGSLFSRAFVFGAVAPAGLIYFLYHPVLEVMTRGRTPGLRKAGARLVTRKGEIPGAGALVMRNAFRLVDSLPVLYVVGLVCCFLTSRHIRLGDLAAGTLLVVDEARDARHLGRKDGLLARPGLTPDALALVHDLIERWPELAGERRVALARTVLTQFDAEFSATELIALDERALHARLKALLVMARTTRSARIRPAD